MCSFSPCIEQVQRTCEELRKHHFEELTIIECLVRSFDIRTINLPIAKLSQSEEDLTEPSVKHAKLDEKSEKYKTSVDISENKLMDVDTVESGTENSDGDADNNSDKPDEEVSGCNDTTVKSVDGKKNTRHGVDLIGKKDDKSFFFKTAAPVRRIPGHTGFLTFATLFPS